MRPDPRGQRRSNTLRLIASCIVLGGAAAGVGAFVLLRGGDDSSQLYWLSADAEWRTYP